MGARARRERLRRALYAPDADAATLARYRSVLRRRRRRLLLPGVAAALALAAGLAVTLPPLLPRAPAPQASPVGPAMRGALLGPDGFADTAAAVSDLPRPLATVRGAGRDRLVLSLDRFGEVVEEDSRIVLLVRCSGGAFRLRLSSVTQGRSQILLAPLTATRGGCDGVQRVRYRPLLGLLPTAVEVMSPGRIEVEAEITGTP